MTKQETRNLLRASLQLARKKRERAEAERQRREAAERRHREQIAYWDAVIASWKGQR
jgi:hypothetical protein